MWINPQVQEILHRQPPHRGFAFKVVEGEEGIFILISVEILRNYSQGQQEDISAWVAGMVTDIRKMRVPCYIQEWKRDED